MGAPLNNVDPVDVLSAANRPWADKLQGNILNGHGRDFTVNLFLTLPGDPGAAQAIVQLLAAGVTSATKQEQERRRFNSLRIPGDPFRGLLLSSGGYQKLGFALDDIEQAFQDAAVPDVSTSFAAGAKTENALTALSDPEVADWEEGFRKPIDALLILGDDDEKFLDRLLGEIVDTLPEDAVAHVEYGRALRTAEGEGIEHFGYVDGRSQPLFTIADFESDTDGKRRERGGGRIDRFDPFAPLGIVLVEDPLQSDEDALGSYFVFRKLEQNVRGFKLAEQQLADVLGLEGGDRERAGATVVGRFEDGTPVLVSQTDGFLPVKENNFTYAGDIEGLKCPLQAHIRKTNPRGESPDPGHEHERRITRRGITFGERPEDPQAPQDIGDLPSGGVGLLFMCFQSSIPKQFGFMQQFWVNNVGFREPGTGLDPIIGQGAASDQNWRARWGADLPGDPPSITAAFDMQGFVTMKGGEFFFAPSIPFLQSLGGGGQQAA